jgi:hypothetical protein
MKKQSLKLTIFLEIVEIGKELSLSQTKVIVSGTLNTKAVHTQSWVYNT